MTLEIALTFAILIGAVVLFITEWIRVDLTALLVLVVLALTGIVTPEEAVAGFSNSAVITAWAVFILSGALIATGVADGVGRQVLRLSGGSEARLLVVLMLSAGVLSAFMNNTGVAALMLPVTINLARQTKVNPSRLLMPLAASTLLGGMLTLIGTPPNILASDALEAAGFQPFEFFDFAPMGAILLLIGILFMLLLGRRLLPQRSAVEALDGRSDDPRVTSNLYDLDERLAAVLLPEDSPLAGHTLGKSRIGRALGLTILGLQHPGSGLMPITATTVLSGGDHLLALGKLDRLEELSGTPNLIIEPAELRAEELFAAGIGLAEVSIGQDSAVVGRTISELGLRSQYGFNVLAVQRDATYYRTDLQMLRLEAGDMLLVAGNREHLVALTSDPAMEGMLHIVEEPLQKSAQYALDASLLAVRLTPDSLLSGKALRDSRLAGAYDLSALAIWRDGEPQLMPGPETVLSAGDLLWLEGQPEDLTLLRGLQTLEIERGSGPRELPLEEANMGLVEAVLAPRTSLLNRTLRDIDFREKYGVTVLAIWHNGRAYRSNLGEMALQPGDAFLLYGPRQKLALLAREPDFVLLTRDLPAPARPEKALLSGIIMLAVVASVLVGWLPIAVAALSGVALMVLTGCLTMEEAYRSIEWKAVFLIACMLPLGIAMETSGAAALLAAEMAALVGGWSGLAVLAGFFVFTSLATQFIPTAVVTVLIAPIAIKTAVDVGISPYSLVMVVAIAASASFMSPVSHPANVLVMGPGGYSFGDYVRLGLPLTLIVLLATLLFLPLIWPL